MVVHRGAIKRGSRAPFPPGSTEEDVRGLQTLLLPQPHFLAVRANSCRRPGIPTYGEYVPSYGPRATAEANLQHVAMKILRQFS